VNTLFIFLRDIKTIILAFAVAALLCVFLPSVALKMEVPGNIYIALLQLCIMPLLMSSLIKSFLLIVSEEGALFKTSKIIIVFFLGLVLVAICGVILAKIVPLGEWISQSPNLSKFMGPEHSLKPLYVTLDEPLNTKTTFVQIIQSIFTSNIFDSLSKSMLLQIIFFSFLFGGAAGCLPQEKKKLMLDFITCVEAIFKKIIEWVLLFLPIGIICIFSYRFLNLSADILVLLMDAIIFSIISMIFIILILNFLWLNN
jgi:proton glutamate symport protein